jgi:Zn-finger nucleic acid-binding protein
MWCGEDLSDIETLVQDYDCPVCDGTLRHQEGQGWSVHICDQCTGIWMSSGMMQKLEKAHEDIRIEGREQVLAEDKYQAKDIVAENSVDMDFKYRRCPECTSMMTRKRYKISSVVLDECMGHGTWFDADEFEKVLAYLKTGGLQKYQKVEDKRRAQANMPRYLKNTGYQQGHGSAVGFFGSFYSF